MLQSLRGFVSPVREQQLPTLHQVLERGVRAICITLLGLIPLVIFTQVKLGLSDPARGAGYNGSLLVALAAILAVSYRPAGRQRPELLLFSITTCMNASLLFAALHSTPPQNPFAEFAFVTPLALAAFAPLRPSLAMLLGLEVLILYPVSLRVAPYPDHVHPALAASITLALTLMAAAACQVQRRLWAEVDRARREALDAAQSKSEFLANVSHEVRTPLTAILGFSEVLAERARSAALPDDMIESLDTIGRNGEHLLEILNDILDLSKIEAGKLGVEPAACAPADVVRDVVALMEPRAREQGLELTLELAPSLPAIIHTDETRLRQILLNLVGNAIKFTERGGVTLRVSLADPATAPRPRLAFDVIDTGIGLSDEEQVRVFEAFAQADGSASRRFGGTGLGLTISRRLAQLLGGDLVVTSGPGLGSVFRATVATGPLGGVPLEAGGRQPESGPPLAPGGAPVAGRVLLAETSSADRRLIATLLRGAGLEVDGVSDGRGALELALAGLERGAPYALIVMDLQLPRLDGYEAAAQLRSAGYAGPILALTARAASDAPGRCLEAGCDAHLPKPVREADLLDAVRRLLEKRAR